MNLRLRQMPQDIQGLIQQQAGFISRTQLPSGAIPWYQGGITDPWDHIECAIALDLSGRFNEAARAYLWLRDVQNPDGSWWFSYLDDQPQDFTRDTNHSSYLAVGLWYHYLATGDIDFIAQMWPTVERGISFTLGLQQPTGEIYWARDKANVAYPIALLAASSCIWQSLRCGIKIAHLLGLNMPEWEAASWRLSQAINKQPELFHNSEDKKYDYAMSWYYPVLTGVVKGKRAQECIYSQWVDFIIDNWGCKCVVEAPWWVTVAETCELVLALTRISEHDKARLLLDWIFKLQDSDGRFWTGMKIPEEKEWPPGQKPAWTSAAVIMAVI
ncbi:MAG: hypothetical protein FD151_1998, partial [bacterium]